MVDTVRSRSDLLTSLFADGQGAGEITPQDMRDLIVSTYGITGWGDYTDTEYSSGSPQSITGGSYVTLQNNAGTKREQELPLDVSSFYDATADSIVGNAGDGIMVTIEFDLRRASATSDYGIEVTIDIGEEGVTEILLYNRTYVLDGSIDSRITITTGAYTLDTWEANGGRVKINATVDIEVWGARIIIHRVHKGQGIYPPA